MIDMIFVANSPRESRIHRASEIIFGLWKSEQTLENLSKHLYLTDCDHCLENAQK